MIICARDALGDSVNKVVIDAAAAGTRRASSPSVRGMGQSVSYGNDPMVGWASSAGSHALASSDTGRREVS